MPRTVTIEPVTRIEGHARIRIRLDESGAVDDARVEITSLRGFEQFVIGRPAEELPRIVSRICGVCPWMHHLAAARAVDGCFAVEPPPADNPLLTAKNCCITPHFAWATGAARRRLLDVTAANVRAFLAGTPQNVVTLG